jgi:hypothetical protein
VNVANGFSNYNEWDEIVSEIEAANPQAHFDLEEEFSRSMREKNCLRAVALCLLLPGMSRVTKAKIAVAGRMGVEIGQLDDQLLQQESQQPWCTGVLKIQEGDYVSAYQAFRASYNSMNIQCGPVEDQDAQAKKWVEYYGGKIHREDPSAVRRRLVDQWNERKDSNHAIGRRESTPGDSPGEGEDPKAVGPRDQQFRSLLQSTNPTYPSFSAPHPYGSPTHLRKDIHLSAPRDNEPGPNFWELSLPTPQDTAGPKQGCEVVPVHKAKPTTPETHGPMDQLGNMCNNLFSLPFLSFCSPGGGQDASGTTPEEQKGTCFGRRHGSGQSSSLSPDKQGQQQESNFLNMFFNSGRQDSMDDGMVGCSSPSENLWDKQITPLQRQNGSSPMPNQSFGMDFDMGEDSRNPSLEMGSGDMAMDFQQDQHGLLMGSGDMEGNDGMFVGGGFR